MGKQAREAVSITTLLQPLGIRGLGRRPWVLLEFERISGLAFTIFTGDQTFLQWTNKRVIVSIITNPRAWSKTMGIASNIYKRGLETFLTGV